MAVINSRAIANGAPIPGFGSGGGQLREQYTTVDVPTGITTTDSLPLFYLPANAIVQSLKLKSDALGGATSIKIGDNGVGTLIAADDDRYLAANNITTAGGVVTTIAPTGLFFRTMGSGNQLLVVMAFTAGTTATAGTVQVSIAYTVEEPQQ